MPFEPDVIVVGAGAAGLAAAGGLTRAGLRVQLLEARDRIGGRIFSLHEPGLSSAIELGAEFIHGRPPEIFDLLGRAAALADAVSGTDWCFRGGRRCPCDFFDDVDGFLSQMQRTPEDESFLAFTRRSLGTPAEIKREAIAYVEGFNAAHAEEISVNSLVQAAEAEAQIEGHRAFRVRGGYDFVPRMLLAAADPENLRISFGAVVQRVDWRPGRAVLTVQSGGAEHAVSASRVLLTLPLGVWQSHAVSFVPALPEKDGALQKLSTGHVVRVTLRFRQSFWEREPARLSDLRFLFSDDEWFPTWWTDLPLEGTLITGWAPAKSAEQLQGEDEPGVIARAVRTLARLTGTRESELNALLVKAYVHDWLRDPFARGAYSYVRVGGEAAQRQLGEPVADTLYFAGEATHAAGHFGTVHGAIATGQRAAGEILASLRDSKAA